MREQKKKREDMKKYSVTIIWLPEDIQQRNPKWSIDECRAWLLKNESNLKDVMTQSGNEILDSIDYRGLK